MFSLGLVMCSIFNQGHALIQANNSASTYLKQMEAVSTNKTHKQKRMNIYWYHHDYYVVTNECILNECEMCEMLSIATLCFPVYTHSCTDRIIRSSLNWMYLNTINGNTKLTAISLLVESFVWILVYLSFVSSVCHGAVCKCG